LCDNRRKSATCREAYYRFSIYAYTINWCCSSLEVYTSIKLCWSDWDFILKFHARRTSIKSRGLSGGKKGNDKTFMNTANSRPSARKCKYLARLSASCILFSQGYASSSIIDVEHVIHPTYGLWIWMDVNQDML